MVERLKPAPGTAPVDVLVVGAGPAGVAAGLTARAAGLDVVLVDKATFPRDKTCGDGLTANALRLLERLGVDVPAIPGYLGVRETVLVSPSGREIRLPLPIDGEHSAVTPRLELDRVLVSRARDSGVPVREATALVGLESPAARPGANDYLRAHFADGTHLAARFVIGADGHWSALRRAWEPRTGTDLGTWHAFRQYFSGVDDPRQWVIFEEDLLPGYAWVFPLPGGRANVGFALERDRHSARQSPGADTTGRRLKELWPALLQRPRIGAVLGPGAVPEDAHRAWPIPASYDPARLGNGRVLYTGDAAAVVDPMTGEGIAQALETGILAAEAIAAGGDPATVLARYRRTVHRTLGRDLRFASLLQRVLRAPLGARGAMRAAGLTDWTRRNFARWMFEDYPRALVLTPDRWRAESFTPPGAFRS